MAKIISISEHFQHFVEGLPESFWGNLYGGTRQAWKKFLELESERLRDRYAGWPRIRTRVPKRHQYLLNHWLQKSVSR